MQLFSITKWANPKNFLALANMLLPFLGGIALLCLAAGLYTAFFDSPPDYQQGIMVRIMYIHVPTSWLALGIYFFMGVASLVYLVWRHTLAALAALAAAPVGATMAFLSLATGALWGQPTWGTWWVWDARLTSMFLLLVLYLGYILVARTTPQAPKAYFACACIALMGLVNLPIIKFSVSWWNTLHQPASLLRVGGPAIHPTMLWPLGLMALGLTALCALLIVVRLQSELLSHKISAHYRRLAQSGSPLKKGEGDVAFPNT